MLKLYYLMIFLLSFPIVTHAQEQNWYYPIQGYEGREKYKTFNQYWSKESYKGKEALFPNQFTGYHVADDLEIRQGEENQKVPVYAVADGKISFVGQVTGYGGLILLDIKDDSHIALYGHVKLNSLKAKAGDSVKAGQEIAVLGDGFSNETGGERKHLHFGMYNGKGIYYRGYETSESTVRSKWVNPAVYLEQKGAEDLGKIFNEEQEKTSQKSEKEDKQIDSSDTLADPTVTNDNTNAIVPAASATDTQSENQGLFAKIASFFKNMFNRAGF